MSIENKEQITQEELDTMYLNQINDLKNKMDNEMISKDEYTRLKEQHKTLLDDFVNRRPAPKKEQVIIRTPEDIVKELNSSTNDITNREYVKLALEYRESVLKTTGRDVFTDFGPKGPDRPTADSEEVANTFKALLEENEDPVSFRIKLNSVLEDDSQLISRLNRK